MEAVHVLDTLPVAYMLPSRSVCLCGVLAAMECFSECVCCCIHHEDYMLPAHLFVPQSSGVLLNVVTQ